MADEGSGDSTIQAAAGDTGIIEHDGVKLVPLTALEGVRSEMKGVKEEAQLLRDQNDLYRANMAAQAQGQGVTVSTVVAGPFADLEDSDAVTVADVKRVLAAQDERWGTIADQLKVAQSEPGYLDMIQKYLPAELQKDPDLADAIKTSKNPALLALKISKGSEAYIKDQQNATLSAAAASGDGAGASQVLANQQKPGATSTGAGAGGGVNTVEFYANMSDEDLEARIQKVGQNS